MHFLLPDPDKFHDMVIMTYNGTNYTSHDLPELFNIMDYSQGYKMWQKTRDTFKGYPFPNVTTHCLRGADVPTPESIEFADENVNSPKAKIIYGPGDGTVNKVSADVCLEWKHHENFHTQEFSGIKHTSILKDPDVVSYVIRQVLHANFEDVV